MLYWLLRVQDELDWGKMTAKTTKIVWSNSSGNAECLVGEDGFGLPEGATELGMGSCIFISVAMLVDVIALVITVCPLVACGDNWNPTTGELVLRIILLLCSAFIMFTIVFNIFQHVERKQRREYDSFMEQRRFQEQALLQMLEYREGSKLKSIKKSSKDRMGKSNKKKK